MIDRDKVAQNIHVLAMASARQRGAVSEFEVAFDGAEIMSYLIADMIGPDGPQKDLAFRAALCAGGAK